MLSSHYVKHNRVSWCDLRFTSRQEHGGGAWAWAARLSLIPTDATYELCHLQRVNLYLPQYSYLKNGGSMLWGCWENNQCILEQCLAVVHWPVLEINKVSEADWFDNLLQSIWKRKSGSQNSNLCLLALSCVPLPQFCLVLLAEFPGSLENPLLHLQSGCDNTNPLPCCVSWDSTVRTYLKVLWKL